MGKIGIKVLSMHPRSYCPKISTVKFGDIFFHRFSLYWFFFNQVKKQSNYHFLNHSCNIGTHVYYKKSKNQNTRLKKGINLVCTLPNIYYIKIVLYYNKLCLTYMQILYIFVLYKWDICCNFLFHLPIYLGDLSISGHTDLSHFLKLCKGRMSYFI